MSTTDLVTTSMQVARKFRIPMLPNENPAAYRAFCDYYRLGPTRNYEELARVYRQKKKNALSAGLDPKRGDMRPEVPPTTSVITIRKWAVMYNWPQRIRTTEASYYDYENQLWAIKKAESRARDFDDAEKLRDLANKILDEGPKFLKTRWITAPDGTRTQIVALDADLAVKALKAASLLQERATGGREETINVNVRYYTVEANPDQWPAAPNIIDGEVIQAEVEDGDNSGIEDSEWQDE